MLETGTLVLIGGGRSLGAFTYVENLADGIFLAGIRDKAAGETYVITDGIELSWKDYFEKLTDALDVPRPRLSLHPTLAWGLASALEGIWKVFRIRSRPPVTRYLVAHLRKDFHFSIDKAVQELGYSPAIGPDEAIRRTALWYRRAVRGEKDDGS
jgi:nucleoside-diphosphate-sugar epimerase